MRLSRLIIVAMTAGVLCRPGPAAALEKRARFTGLYRTESSSTIGRQNLFLSMYGRAFLWDNAAAQKIPTALPHVEVGYGITDFFHAVAGGQMMTTRPSLAFLKLKITTPNNKNIRYFGFGQTFEIYRNLLNEFKSNGFRYRNEGFSPDFFMIGNENIITYYRFMSLFDIETIRISAFLPFKFYFNIGFEGGIDWLCSEGAPSCWFDSRAKGRSWMGDKIEEALGAYGGADGGGSTNFQKIPLRIGAELKTQATDFFIELEAEPFLEHVKSVLRNPGNADSTWVRFNIVLEGSPPKLKIFDINMFETPIYVSAGGRLKYPNGMMLHGGASWLLSRDLGPTLGPCSGQNVCREGASDGFSPFNPQWRIFGGMTIPLKFKQTSAELYRTYLLRGNRNRRTIIDIDEDLEKEKTEFEDVDAGRPADSGKKILYRKHEKEVENEK